MRFFLVDDDEVIRSMLTEIIEDCNLGEVVGEAQNGAEINSKLLSIKKVDILIIDLLMPVRDGLETVREVAPLFEGKIIMLSQIEDKKMVGEAYSLGVEYYITKPINRLEVVGVIQKVIEHMRLQKSIYDIQNTLNFLTSGKAGNKEVGISKDKDIISAGQIILTDLGIIGESGSKDLLEILKYLSEMEGDKLKEHEFPSLKDIFLSVAEKRLGSFASDDDIKKEIKASEQRVRRAIYQGLSHLASLGLTDYSNPKFEEYASKFFDFTEVRKKMLEIQSEISPSMSNVRLNTKKFIKILYLESRKKLSK